jgi:hypothetical protein
MQQLSPRDVDTRVQILHKQDGYSGHYIEFCRFPHILSPLSILTVGSDSPEIHTSGKHEHGYLDIRRP